MKIDASNFNATQLGHVAGADRKLINLWLERGLISPTKLERVGDRNRPKFSVIAIFKARLMKVLSETLSISPSSSMLAGNEAERAAKPSAAVASSITHMANTLADEGWMWAVARSVDRGKPLALFAAINRAEDCWRFFMEFDVGKFPQRFLPKEPYAVIPIGVLFAEVYRQCKTMHEVDVLKQQSKKPRRA
jgi:hypothetical protein